mmetsp:Transcript_4419/g.18104  ORF Transcript_4419/g.18104 Transcript_4419/m.18104 type:complete len:416 (-) Transcript_4419:688-1935(-)
MAPKRGKASATVKDEVMEDVKPELEDIVMAPPPGSEHLSQALDDFLRSRKAPNSRRILHRLLGILHPNNLRAAAHELRYNKPQWSDDNTTPAQYRAHWRVQASKIVGCKEDAFPEPVINALRGFLWPGCLDTQRGEHLAWLVKVPAFVTRAWRAASDALDEVSELDGGGTEIDGGKVDDKELLGRMRITVDPFAPPEKRQRHFLTLEDNVSSANRIPKEYDMVMTPDDQPIHVFSDVRENTAAAAARAAARVAAERALAGRGLEGQPSLPHDEFVLEGAVSEKFDVRPASVTDEAYRATHLRRIEEATKKTRVMGDVKGPQRTVPLPKARNIAQRLDGKEDVKEKAERLEKHVLEDRLMGLFERQSLWRFKQLVAETRQPAVWLKEVLTELAVLNRRGPNTGMYALKEEYRRRGA